MQVGMAFQNGRELRIIIPGSYLINWSLTMLTSTSFQEISGAIFLNGVRQLNGTIHTTTVSPNMGVAVSGSSIISHLVAGDLLSMGVRNENY